MRLVSEAMWWLGGRRVGMAAHLGRAPRGQRMGAGEVFGYRAEMFLIR